jgi:L-asparagine transporter-like permease
MGVSQRADCCCDHLTGKLVYHSITVSRYTEKLANRTFIQFWAPQVQAWEWAIVIIIPVFLLQLIHVRVYGV